MSDSIIFDLPNHRAGYILDMEFLNLDRRPSTCRIWSFSYPGRTGGSSGCPTPGRRAAMQRMRRVGSQNVGGCNFHRGIAFRPPTGWSIRAMRSFNHYLAENGKFTRKPMRGLLLAIGARMPKGLPHGFRLEASLVLRDVEGIAHRHAVTFCVDCSRAVTPKRATQNPGLFEPAPKNYQSGIADHPRLPQTVRRKIGRSGA